MVTYDEAVAYAKALGDVRSRLHRTVELADETVIPEIPPLRDFVPEPEDDTWMITYAVKPEWWDDPEQPHCDYCGVHCEDSNISGRGNWCGDCGQCGDHCEC